MKIRKILEIKELRLRKKRIIAMIGSIAVIIVTYVILTWQEKKTPDAPMVSVEPVGVEDVEIYGDYVGRVRAQ